MFKVLRQIEAADWVVVATGLAVVVALEFLPENARTATALPEERPVVMPVSAAPVQAPAVFPAATDLRYHRDPNIPHQPKLPPMGNEVRNVLRTDFRKAAYFGAFALSANAAAFGWSAGYASIPAADAAALARCHSFGPDCKVIARLWPKSLAKEPTQPTLSYAQGRAYRQIAATKGPRAFAYALDGHWAVARNSDAAKAGAAAVTACEQKSKSNMSPTNTPCSLLALWQD